MLLTVLRKKRKQGGGYDTLKYELTFLFVVAS